MYFIPLAWSRLVPVLLFDAFLVFMIFPLLETLIFLLYILHNYHILAHILVPLYMLLNFFYLDFIELSGCIYFKLLKGMAMVF